jgi:phosphoglycerate-specific signal transduction histidine kinase
MIPTINHPATMNPIRLMIQLLLVASASAFATPRLSSLRSLHLRATPDEVANEVRIVVFTLAASAAILKQGFDIIYGSGKTDAKLVEYNKAIDKLSDIPGQLKQLGTDMKGMKADMKQQSTDTNNRMNDMNNRMNDMNNRMNDMNNRMNDKFDELIIELRQGRTEVKNEVIRVADDLGELDVKVDDSVRLLKKSIRGEFTALAGRITTVENDAQRAKKSANRMESMIVDSLNGLNSTVQGLSLQVQGVRQAVARLEAAAADAPVPAVDPKRMAKGGRM